MKIFRQMLVFLFAIPVLAQTPTTQVPNAVTVCTESQSCTVTAISDTTGVLQFGAGTGATWCQSFTNPPLPMAVSYANPPDLKLCPYDPAPGVVKTLVGQRKATAWTITVTLGTAKQTVNIPALPITPTITWPVPASVVSGTALSATQLNATAAAAGVIVPGTFTYTPPSGTTVIATTTLSVLFTPTDLTHFTIARASVPLVVKSPVSTFPAQCTNFSDTTFTCVPTGPITRVVSQ